jgi:hypothetical protein
VASPVVIRERSKLAYRNPRCYASERWRCSTKLSGEHWLSKSVLSAFVRGDKGIAIIGHHWQQRELERVGIASLTAKVLCREHNTALSPLDDRIAGVFRHLASMDRILTAADPAAHAVHCVNGHDFERWLLKAFLGAMKAGAWKQTNGGPVWWPPTELLAVLFASKSLPASFGLTLSLPRAGETFAVKRSL